LGKFQPQTGPKKNPNLPAFSLAQKKGGYGKKGASKNFGVVDPISWGPTLCGGRGPLPTEAGLPRTERNKAYFYPQPAKTFFFFFRIRGLVPRFIFFQRDGKSPSILSFSEKKREKEGDPGKALPGGGGGLFSTSEFRFPWPAGNLPRGQKKKKRPGGGEKSEVFFSFSKKVGAVFRASPSPRDFSFKSGPRRPKISPAARF